MIAKISKCGNYAGHCIPSDILKFLSLHIGDSVELLKKDNSIEIRLFDDKREKLIAEAKRIKKHSEKEYSALLSI